MSPLESLDKWEEIDTGPTLARGLCTLLQPEVSFSKTILPVALEKWDEINPGPTLA